MQIIKRILTNIFRFIIMVTNNFWMNLKLSRMKGPVKNVIEGEILIRLITSKKSNQCHGLP